MSKTNSSNTQKKFNQQRLNEYLVQKGVIGFKSLDESPLTLKSGKESRWYANCRVLSQTLITSTEFVNEYILPFLRRHFINRDKLSATSILGVPQGATFLGNEVQRKLILNGNVEDRLYQIRDKPKEHGDIANRYWINGNVPGSLVLIEDVTTTGGSAIEFIKKLRESGVEVKGLIGILNRLQLDENGLSVVDKMKELEVPYYSMTNAKSVLPVAIEYIKPGRKVIDFINQEFKKEYSDFGKKVPLVLN